MIAVGPKSIAIGATEMAGAAFACGVASRTSAAATQRAGTEAQSNDFTERPQRLFQMQAFYFQGPQVVNAILYIVKKQPSQAEVVKVR